MTADVRSALPARLARKPFRPRGDMEGPFGGIFTAGFTFATDYSTAASRQTQRQVAVRRPSVTSALVRRECRLQRLYVGAWGGNVNFPGTGTTAEIDLLAGFPRQAR